MTKLKDILASRKQFGNTALWLTDDEAGILYTITAFEKPKIVYESGSANGFSASIFASLDILVQTYDPVDRPKVWNSFPEIEENIIFHNDRFSTAERVSSEKSLFFIDGDHSRASFREDIQRVEELLIPGDVIVLHDVFGYAWIGRYYIQSELEKILFSTRRGIAFFRNK